MSNIHWSVKKLRSYNSYISMIVGDRGVGKTYSLTKEVLINDFLKNGTQFMYIRRKNTELDKIGMFFDDMIANKEFEGHEFEVVEGIHGGKFYIDGKLAGHAFPLSLQQYIKSVPWPKVGNVLFDEFIIDVGGSINYMGNEIILFLEMVQSIFRLRWGNVYLVSNALSVGNPYFTYFDINMDFLKEGKNIKIFKQFFSEDSDYKQYNGLPLIVVEFVDKQAYKEKAKNAPFFQLVEGTPYGDYALGSEFLRDRTKFIKKKTPEAKCQLTIIHESVKYGLWVDYEKGEWYIDNTKTDQTRPVITIIGDEHDPTRLYVDRSNYRIKEIKTAYRNGWLWFNSERCFGQFKEVLRLIGL